MNKVTNHPEVIECKMSVLHFKKQFEKQTLFNNLIKESEANYEKKKV